MNSWAVRLVWVDKSPARLPDVGTTTDRIAQSLLVVARRAWTAGRSREATARGV